MITNILLIIVIIINIVLVILALNSNKKSDKGDFKKLENQFSSISKDQERMERSIRDEIVTNRNEKDKKYDKERLELSMNLAKGIYKNILVKCARLKHD